jgi:hypothetical protein
MQANGCEAKAARLRLAPAVMAATEGCFAILLNMQAQPVSLLISDMQIPEQPKDARNLPSNLA